MAKRAKPLPRRIPLNRTRKRLVAAQGTKNQRKKIIENRLNHRLQRATQGIGILQAASRRSESLLVGAGSSWGTC